MTAHAELITASRPGNLAIGIAELFELQERIGIQLIQTAASKKRRLTVDQAAQLGEEPWIDAAEGMNLLITATLHHRGAHSHDPIG